MNPENDAFVVVDVETSGTNPFVHQVLAVAFAPINESISPVSIYVRDAPITWSAWAKTNFEQFAPNWEHGAVDPVRACSQIEAFLLAHYGGRDVTLVGHNVGFDLAFLRKLAFAGGREELAHISHRGIDTHTLLYALSKRGLYPAASMSSEAAFQHFSISVPQGARHTALGDALATRQLFLRIVKLLGSE